MNPNQTPDQPQPQYQPPAEPVTPVEPAAPAPSFAPAPPETPVVATPTSGFQPSSNFKPAGVVVGSDNAAQTSTPVADMPPTEPGNKPRKFTKKKAILFGAPLLAVLLIGGGVFGLYLPNTPGNVYKTGLSRTGQALEKVVATATEEDNIEAYTTSELSGDFSATVDGSTFSGDLVTKFDEETSDSNLNVSIKEDGQAEKKLNALLLTEKVKENMYPDFYFKFTGLGSLGLDGMVNTAALENRWVVVGSDYLESLTSAFTSASAAKEEKATPEPTAADISELSGAVTKVSREYVFGTDPEKAVFEQKSFVGKETVDGVKTYHYKVAARSKQTEAYCKELVTQVMATKACKKLSEASAEELTKQRKSAQESCTSSVKESSKDKVEDLDLWVDAKYKLIYKIRAYDDKDKSNYYEVGQNYKGGDDINLFGRYVQGDKGKGEMTLTSNMKTQVTKMGVTYNLKEDGKSADFKLNMTAKPTKGKVNITKPTDAITIEQLMQELGYGGSSASNANMEATLAEAELAEEWANNAGATR